MTGAPLVIKQPLAPKNIPSVPQIQGDANKPLPIALISGLGNKILIPVIKQTALAQPQPGDSEKVVPSKTILEPKLNRLQQSEPQKQINPDVVENLIKSLSQTTFPESVNNSAAANPASSGPQLSTLKVIAPAPPPGPQTATLKIFAPKTKEMNKGYLMYSDDESGLTMLKDEPEPEDLTHLAPTAGDVCIPLAASPLFSDVLDTFMLSDNYGPLLSEASKEISPANSPFFTYRDDLSNSGSLSPALTHSPGGCSLPSLCSLGEDSPHLETTLLGLDLVDSSVDADTDDFTVKAPYIPMSGGDDLPLLTGDLMWGAGLTSPSGSSSSSRTGWSSSSSPSPGLERKPDMDSSLAKLLRTDTNPANRTSHHSITCRKGGGGGGGGVGSDLEKRKRAGCPDVGRGAIKRSRQHLAKARPDVHDGGGKNSVLMNLLVSGCDISAGYVCLNSRKPYSSASAAVYRPHAYS